MRLGIVRHAIGGFMDTNKNIVCLDDLLEATTRVVQDAYSQGAKDHNGDKRVWEIKKIILEAVEYLNSNNLNQIGAESIIHRNLREALNI